MTTNNFFLTWLRRAFIALVITLIQRWLGIGWGWAFVLVLVAVLIDDAVTRRLQRRRTNNLHDSRS